MYGETDQYGNKQLEICAYEPCSSYFLPTKRFAQKYCCESCRVMAYRKRKYGEKTLLGLAGRPYDHATNKDLSDMIQKLQKEVNTLSNGALIGGGIMVILQLMQLSQTGALKDLTQEQQNALNELRSVVQKDEKLKGMWESLMRS